MNWISIIIIKGKMLYYTSLYSFEFFCFFGCSCALYCFSTLTLLIVSSIMTLFFTVYTSSISEPLLLLWSLPKCLSLLEFLVWLLLLWLLSIGILTFRFLRPVAVVCMSRFLYTVKIYWFQTSVPLSYCLLW